jgi:hypothetical protein
VVLPAHTAQSLSTACMISRVTHIYIYTHIYIHTHIHTHTYTYTYTHTHIHTQMCIYIKLYLDVTIAVRASLLTSAHGAVAIDRVHDVQ